MDNAQCLQALLDTGTLIKSNICDTNLMSKKTELLHRAFTPGVKKRTFETRYIGSRPWVAGYSHKLNLYPPYCHLAQRENKISATICTYSVYTHCAEFAYRLNL